MNFFIKLLNGGKIFLKKNSSTILTVTGVAGVVGTAVLAINATPKAQKLIEEAKKKSGKNKLTPMETIKAAGKVYIPMGIVIVGTVSAMVVTNRLNAKLAKEAATFAGLYTAAKKTAAEYKKEVVNTIGEEKEKNIRANIAQKQMEGIDFQKAEVFETGYGGELWMDAYHNRLFRSSWQNICKAELDIVHMLQSQMYGSLEEIYNCLGLPGGSHDQYIGCRIDDIDVPEQHPVFDRLPSIYDENGVPCGVIDFKPEFYKEFNRAY